MDSKVKELRTMKEYTTLRVVLGQGTFIVSSKIMNNQDRNSGGIIIDTKIQ